MTDIWQHPYVDIFRTFAISDWVNSRRIGDVTESLDSNIARKVLVLKGSIPANNYIQLPKPSASLKSLNLTGRYLYILLKPFQELNFVLHFDYQIPVGTTLRISLSNIYKEAKREPFQILEPLKISTEKWSCVVIDSHTLLQNNDYIKPGQKTILKSMTLCSNITIFKIATSDMLYAPFSIPREISFKLKKAERWADRFNWIQPYGELPPMLPIIKEMPKLKTMSDGDSKDFSSDSEKEDASEKNFEESKKFMIKKKKTEEAKEKFMTQISSLNKENENRINIKNSDKQQVWKELLPIPKITFQHKIGYSSESCKSVLWSNFSNEKRFLFASGTTLIDMELISGKQKFFHGHTSSIISFCVSVDGKLIVTCDQQLVKFWERFTQKVIGLINLKEVSIKTLCLTKNSSELTIVYKDRKNRDVLSVYDLSNISEPKLIAKQSSFFNILCIKYLSDSSKLCSCGQENIRFWRIKNGHLPGSAVVLNEHSRNSVFTCLDIDKNLNTVFVSSKHGMVFRIDGNNQELLSVFHVLDSEIFSISVNESLCLTGSADQLLRIWPLDFVEFFMEAKHEGAVVSTNISDDGIAVICGTNIGTIGYLDISKQKYSTLLRSHINNITGISLVPKLLITCSEDRTIRIWNRENYEQIYEFSSLEDLPLCVACHPNQQFFASGFQSGSLRIFDIEKTSVCGEFRQFNHPLLVLHYLAIHNKLITMADDGCICIHNSQSHQPIKSIDCQLGTPYISLTVSQNESIFACNGPNATSIDIYDTASLSKMYSIPLQGCQAILLQFQNGTDNIIAITNDSKIKFISSEGIIKKKCNISAIDPSSVLLTPNSQFLMIGDKSSNIHIIDATFPPISVPDAQMIPCYLGLTKEMAFCPDSKLLFSANGNNVTIWKLEGHYDEIAFEPNDNLFPRNIVPKPITQTRDYKTQIVAEDNEDIIPENKKNAEYLLRESAMFIEDKAETPHLIEQSRLGRNEKKANEQLNSLCNFDVNLRVSASLATIGRVEEEDEIQIKQKISSEKPLNGQKTVRKQNVPSFSVNDEFILDKSTLLQNTLVSGYSSQGIDNIVWNRKKGYFAYPSTNKLIIESVKDRIQHVILCNSPLISTLASTLDYSLIGVGTFPDSVGYSYLIIYSTENKQLTEIRRIKFKTTGIQGIRFSNDRKIICVISKSPDSTIRMISIETGKEINSVTLDYNPNSIILRNTDKYEVISIGKNKLSWIILTQNNLIPKEFTYSQIGSVDDFEFTSLSEYHSIILLGTNKASVVVFDISTGNFLNQYPVYDSEIDLINFSNNFIIIGGRSNTIHKWAIPQGKNLKVNQSNLFASRPKILSVDGNIIALEMEESGKDGIIGTDLGSIWYINWEDCISVKFLSSHSCASIQTLALGSEHSCATSGLDDTIRVWNSISCEQLYQFELPHLLCQSLSFHPTEELCVGGFEDGNIRFFNTKEKKILGKVKVSEYSITSVIFSTKGKCILIGDKNGQVFILSIDSFAPLSVRTQKLCSLDSGISCISISRVKDSAMFLAGINNGKVYIWSAQKNSKDELEDAFNNKKDAQYMLEDIFDIAENPHGINSNESSNLYNISKSHEIDAKFSRINLGIVYVIDSILQFLYIRDVLNHTLRNTISLLVFPVSIDVGSNSDSIVIGTTNGVIKLIRNENQKNIKLHCGRVDKVAFNENESKILSTCMYELVAYQIDQKN